MKQLTLLFIILFIFAGCRKTEVNGFVYSKHGFPVANGTIILIEKKSTSATIPGNNKNIATTDNNGYYHFEFKWKYNKMYYVRCKSDSGDAVAEIIHDKKKNTIIINSYYQ